MQILKLNGCHKTAMRELVSSIHAEQGMKAEFYWPEDMLRAEMVTAEGLGLFFEEKLVCFVLYRELANAWDISLVATHPQFRQRGFMRELLSYLIDAAPHGVELWLEVHEENVAAQKLYEKLGFKEVGRRPRYYKDGASAVLYSYS